jgi:hypothetical protein
MAAENRRRRWIVMGAVTFVAALLGFFAGAATERDSSPGDGRRSPTTPASPNSALTLEAGNRPLPDGRQFGYLTDADAQSRLVTFDLAQWLSGDAANRAAVEDGQIEQGEEVANDSYVRNINRRTRVLRMSPDARIVIARIDCTPTCDPAGTFEGLAGSFDDDTPHDLYSPYRGADTQYWITVRDGVVVEIEEQYSP